VESGTHFATALHMNICSFHRAIYNDAQHTTFQNQIRSMQSEILELKKRNKELSEEVLLMKKLLSDGEDESSTNTG